MSSRNKTVDGRNITLIDTPGFFDTDRSEEKLKPEIVKCVTEFAPGPHAFLIVLKVERFTKQDQAVITKINQYFTEEVFKYATVLFTHGDQLKEGQTIEDFVRDNKLLGDLVKKCGGRCHVIDNKYWKNNQQDEYRSNQVQVKELLNTIEKMIEANKGSCFNNEMLQAVEEMIKQEEECIRQSPGDMSKKEIRKKTKANIFKRIGNKLAGITTVFKRRRIVILGKTGVGKSSLANTIFGKELFEIGHTVNSETKKCRAKTRSVNGRNITLIDTPGLFDTDRPEEELKSEIVKCVTEFAPGPHAFLIVFEAGRFTEQEQAVITKINQCFSEEAFKYATVLFTHGDQLPEGQNIEDFVRNNKHVSDLLKKCGGRCHVIDNKYWKNNQQDEYRSNQFQVKELLNTIEKMIEANEGSCYTNEMLQAVEEMIKQEEERIRQSPGNMSEEEITEKAKDTTSERLLKQLAGITTGAVLGAIFGVVVMGRVVILALEAGLAFAKIAAAAGIRAAGTPVAVETVPAVEVGVTAGTAAAGTAAGAAAAGTAAAGAAAAGAAAAGTAAAGTAAAGKAAAGKAAAGTAAAGTAVAGAAAAGKAAAAAKSAISVTVACAVVGAVAGGVTGYFAAEEAETPWEAAEKAAEAVMNRSKSILDFTKSKEKSE